MEYPSSMVGELLRQILIKYCPWCGKPLPSSKREEYFDSKQKLVIRKNSNVGDPNYAMITERLSDNKILYKCKPPYVEDFAAFVFSVEWDLAN